MNDVPYTFTIVAMSVAALMAFAASPYVGLKKPNHRLIYVGAMAAAAFVVSWAV